MPMGRPDGARTPGLRIATSELLATDARISPETPYIPFAGRAVTTHLSSHRSSGVRPRQEAVSRRLALVPV